MIQSLTRDYTSAYSHLDLQHVIVPEKASSVPNPVIIGITGASGMIYAVRTLKFLLKQGYSIAVVASRATAMVWQREHNMAMPLNPEQQTQFWRDLAQEESGKLTCYAAGKRDLNFASYTYLDDQ